MTSITLQYRVESLIDRMASDLLDRTGRDVSIEEFDTLTQELSVRLDDLLTELIWDAPGSTARPIGDNGTRAGDEPETEGLSKEPDSERRGVPD